MDGLSMLAAFWDVSSACARGVVGGDGFGHVVVIILDFLSCLCSTPATVHERKEVDLIPMNSGAASV